MTDEKYRSTILSLLGGTVLLLAFAVGFLIIRPSSSEEPYPDFAAADPSPARVPYPEEAPTPPREAPFRGDFPSLFRNVAPTHAPASASANFPEAKLDDPASWAPMAAGCAIEQVGSKISIVGVNAVSGWGHGNGITSKNTVPEGDFYCHVDFMIPKFSGNGAKLVYLRPHSVDGTGKMFAIRYTPGNPGAYSLQGWAAPDSSTSGSGSLRGFGDEDHAFHRMKIKYDSAAKLGYAWVDEKFIGSIKYTLVDAVKFEMFANTQTAGVEIDLRWENFYCSSDTSAAPPVPPPAPAPARPAGSSSPAGGFGAPFDAGGTPATPPANGP